MKKIGILLLALVLALGSLGIGYAAWTDTIFVSGTVQTGSLDLKIVELSSTLIYKVPGEEPDEMVIVHQKENLRDLGGGIGWHIVNVPPKPSVPPAILVASAMTTSPSDDHISVVFNNAFPLEELTADFLIHCEGTIPVKVSLENIDFTGDPEDLALLAEVAEAHFYWSDDSGTQGAEITTCPVQMENCDYVLCIMTLAIPQEDQYMGLSGGFTAEITAIQWNKYVP